MLSLIILLTPVVTTVLLFLCKAEDTRRIHRLAFVSTTITLVAALLMWVTHKTGVDAPRFQDTVDLEWVPALGMGFRLGVDGISVIMVVLTAFVIWAGCFVSNSIKDRVKEHYILLMALVTGVFGVFLSLDLFFFYFFYEMAVIPMYLLIGVWGSRAAQYS